MNQAERLKKIRNNVGLSQPKFAESIGETLNKINNIENSRNEISIETAKKIREKYNVSFIWLLLGEGPMFLDKQKEFDVNIKTVRLKKGQLLKVEYEE